MTGASHEREVARGERFEFGRNWERFLKEIDHRAISEAETSLTQMLAVDRLDGKRFVDVGSGSGLSSLAARNLGAIVVSLDYDPMSVACTRELRRRYRPDDEDWTIEAGSVLDTANLSRLGVFDVVYSWGVLHHTGALFEAMGNIVGLVGAGGTLFIAVYNDQGWRSRYWKLVKKLYNRGLRWPVVVLHVPYLFAGRWVLRGLRGHWSVSRGMSMWRDMIDWLGGYPFEVARPEDVFGFYSSRGFRLERLTTAGARHGCNQFVFAAVS